MTLDHLRLTEWPFRPVPDASSAQLWADRSAVRRDLEILMRKFQRSDASSINLLWAYFGAGKTHFLHHLRHLTSGADSQVLTFYTVFPRSARTFVGMYQGLMDQITDSSVTLAYQAVVQGGRLEDVALDDELERACRTMMLRPELIPVLMDWLRGRRVLMKDVREAGITRKIESPERAVEVASSVFRLLRHGHQARRIVWMIDEFQTIGELSPNVSASINRGLHSLFNDQPLGFTLLLSFSFGTPKNIQFLLSEELLDRAKLERYIQMPAMTMDDAAEFVRDVLKHYRAPSPDPEVEPWFPFNESSAHRLIQLINEHRTLELKPRTLMQAFNAVLEEGDVDVETGTISSLDSAFVERIFLERSADLIADDTQENDE